MNNQEMLELAAKAIGLRCYEYVDRVGMCELAVHGVPHCGHSGKVFNSMDDSGDALRVAVKLGMEVYIDNHPEGCQCVEVESHTHKAGRVIVGFESHESNEAAARYAITLCAAEIGKQMP